MNTKKIDYYITAEIQGNQKKIGVIELETTDGAPYYSCFINGTELTQLRNETHGKWQQLWGNLPIETIQHIGEKISEKKSSL